MPLSPLTFSTVFRSFPDSFKLLAWLLFTPSHWRAYLATIDPELSPKFALVQLSSRHWRVPELRHLLYAAHLITPLWVTAFVAVILMANHVPDEELLLALSYSFCLSFSLGFLGSLLVSVPFGIMMGSIGGVLLSMPVGLNGEIKFSMAENLAIGVMLSINEAKLDVSSDDPLTLLTVLFGIFAVSQAGMVMHSVTATPDKHPFYRQIGSVMLGVLVSSVAIFLMANTASISARGAAALMENAALFSMVYDGLISSLFGIALILIWLLQRGHFFSALSVGLGAGIGLSSLNFLKNYLSNFPEWFSLAIGVQGGVENALLYICLFSFPYALANRIANSWAGVIAGIFGSVGAYVGFTIFIGRYPAEFIIPLALLAFVLGISFNWWRALLFYPLASAWNLFLQHHDEKGQYNLLRLHSVFWDEYQYIPLFGLENYVVQVTEHHPEQGKAVLEYLSNSPQSWAAQEVQIELDARRLQNCQTVPEISTSYHQLAAGELQGSTSALLRSFSRISRDVEAALAQGSLYNQRLALTSLEERLDGLLRELTRSSEPYALRFRPIAAGWRQILADYAFLLGVEVEKRQEIANPYIFGIPLAEHQEIFVGRSDIIKDIEKLLLDRLCPPLLLYGQRRTGKTSLLNNLGRLLPSTIIPLFVDLQGPTSLARDYAGFLYNIARAMISSAKTHRDLVLPSLSREALQIDPFTAFDEWFDAIEQKFGTQYTFLLSLDEFSVLEHFFNKGFLDEASVLGMFRHIIQHRARFKILLSGSHTIDEFERWSSYLINVRIVHISYLQATEALQLVEHPVSNFALHYTPEASRRVLKVTRCHPALIQLLCSELVELKNRQPVAERWEAHLHDVDAVLSTALKNGRFFFADISNNQIDENGLKILQLLAIQGEDAVLSQAEFCDNCQISPLEFENSMKRLLQRELVESLGAGYRFQVELIRRWFLPKDSTPK